ncbi:uncharacterized protein BX663DRAFT_424664 [Cokeromyces recurvatus]|uniref:uncharacterized protein n=1 Tax=Cokeromyces recurvatus TaxID=90255 RepID=UPI00221E6AB0|nr:uncharacterized protein BX663DRAFT_424664 [Cokeromyces recurvatus]KAI7907808.1 hypothetical protein BX663DRAFT_424664 [Cokeromyces recurvatus]
MVNDNNKENNKQKGLLPPQALLSTPPPEDTSTLTSPWWSEETTEDNNNSNTDNNTSSSDSIKAELENVIDESKKCSMVCFLKTSQNLLKQQQEQKSKFNPFYGTWISVAKTPKRCKEHLLIEGTMTKKNHPDYYRMELGEELSRSGEYISKAIQRTFTPLQHFTQRYISSWKDGSQQAFFSKLWSSMQKGDAFYLVKESTKRLIENAMDHDKKPNDKK